MNFQYRYVGPAEIADRVQSDCGGAVIDSAEKLKSSLRLVDGYQSGESLAVTFVVGANGMLRIADRRSEHVACTRGKDVLSAEPVCPPFLPRGILSDFSDAVCELSFQQSVNVETRNLAEPVPCHIRINNVLNSGHSWWHNPTFAYDTCRCSTLLRPKLSPTSFAK